MTDTASIKKALQDSGRSQKECVLLLLAFDESRHMRPPDIVALAAKYGRAEAAKWNISAILLNAKGLVLRYSDGWTLSPDGITYVEEFVSGGTSTKSSAGVLRKELARIKDSDTRAFVDEAVSCLERDLKRAAVVLSWVDAVSVLYDHVVAHKLAAFNAEASRRDNKWRTATTKDDLLRMKEADFLDILTAISVLGKNVKEHLKNTCLNLCNSSGHPNSFRFGKHTVEAHLEALILNVFQKF